MSYLTKIFHFILFISKQYNIDESHGLSHSMNVLNFAFNIYNHEVVDNPALKGHERIIYVSALLHDMCDKKYMDEKGGIIAIEEFLFDKLSKPEIDIAKDIIQTMSYSKVKKNGFPDLEQRVF